LDSRTIEERILLLAPTNRPDFTAAIVDALADRNLTVIAPVRPGSWGTERRKKWEPRSAARQYLSLIDRLSLGRVSLVGLRTGGPYAVELARHRIRCNAILPGLIRTKFAGALIADEEQLKHYLGNHPLGRVGEPQDIAGAALFLASDASAYVTGEYLVVDGGFLT